MRFGECFGMKRLGRSLAGCVSHEAMRAFLPSILLLLFTQLSLAADQPSPTNGLVGLRPLPRTAADLGNNHGGPWAGCPTYDTQKGNYPFVAKNLDVVMQWMDGDFQTKRGFFEYYWGLTANGDSLDPAVSPLVREIHNWEQRGGTIEHILICREYRLAVHRGYKNARPGPFREDTRILSLEDVANIRKLFRMAHEKGFLKQDNYKLIQMVEHPLFFAQDPRVKPIIDSMDGVAYEAHMFNRHWPLETGWSKPENVARGALWTLNQGKEYIFYFGPIIWKCKQYHPFIEREWMEAYWKAGLPKQHPRMHYYLNLFPNESGRGRPVGPESDPHSDLGFTKWMIEQVKGVH